MKIFAAGIATETNTFSPIPTALVDFSVQRGRDVLQGRVLYPGLDLTATWGEQAQAHGAGFVFSLMAFAQPAGTTIKSAYEALRDEILCDLQAAMPVDIVLMSLHGAMMAQGYDDCEEDMIHRVRAIVGPNAVIGVQLDLHCHLRESTLEAADIVITYKEYPHSDINDRGRELFDLALRARRGEVRPTQALFDCRMVGLYPTTRQPLRGFVDEMVAAEQRKGVLSVSFGHGFQFADVPHMGAKMLVVTDNDPSLARQVAHELGMRVHALRREIGFESVSLPMEVALSKALASRKQPVVVADQSDNAGGGAGGDSTFALRWLLDHGAEDIAIALIYDPEVVKIAKKAGPGSTLPIRLGGKLGPASGDPVDIEVTVLSTIDGYVQSLKQRSGASWSFPPADVVAVRCGSIDIIVSSERGQCFSPAIFTALGIDPARKRVLVPKSTQHFYDEFAPIAGEVLYMAASGALPPDPRRIAYRRFDTRQVYPWVEDPFAS